MLIILNTKLYTFITVKLTKPWTPEIFMECYCVARNKPTRCVITKPRTATVIKLWFWGLLAYPELYCDWSVHNQHSWNFWGVHGLLSLTVIIYCKWIQKVKGLPNKFICCVKSRKQFFSSKFLWWSWDTLYLLLLYMIIYSFVYSPWL